MFQLKITREIRIKINSEHLEYIVDAFCQNKVTLALLDDKKYIFNDNDTYLSTCALHNKSILSMLVNAYLSVCISIRSIYISSLGRRADRRERLGNARKDNYNFC